VRDACALVEASRLAGLADESVIAAGWVSQVLDGTGIPISPVWDASGNEPAEEAELSLDGWRRSQPVRVGTAAGAQHPLDLYADLASVFHAEDLMASGPMLERWGVMRAATDWVADHWADADTGIWELRSPPRQHIASKVACWFTLDRMTRLARALNPLDLDAVGWFAAARDALAWLEASPVAAPAARLVDVADVHLLDAALLQMAWLGPWPADHEVVVRTVDRIVRNLSTGAFVSRYPPEYDDGLPGREGAHLQTSFWAVRALAATGRWDEAHERMEVLCGLNQPLGLLSEEIDATSATLLGNLPAAGSHLALVQAALALHDGPR
jgi:GH15 family glucan-1,4-alpha-glucosidase